MSPHDAFFAALHQPAAAPPAGLRSWNGSDLGQRFAVYRNNRIVSLTAALADGFPVLQQLVGDACFNALARHYIEAHPPESPALFEYGEALPDFVAASAPMRPYPYLADIARLEWMRTRAWHAADALPLTAAQFQAWLQTPETLPERRLRMHPSLQILDSDYACFDIWHAHQQAEPPQGFNTEGPQQVLVLRRADTVEVTLIDPGVAALIHALARGATLGDALQAASGHAPGFEPAAALATLIRSQCCCGAPPSPEPH
ncbi:putative DNA-binding domain-containing protein [Niveibacterium sp. 24ML]|uniref:HvfC/BufC N-terminal domain-containing protein n=1 Tax=Niveibacterium sp. 24ML TaxID=2985512 RepID=UPI002270D3E0|nr:putative DNA-binding domain-containing protein [Niveibacterium sp. 24ML]MCX9156847.1 putative DNA-binding domain-containing protein [Niveibacterium sp. 24ML]